MTSVFPLSVETKSYFVRRAASATRGVSPRISATILLTSASGPSLPKPGMLSGSLKFQSFSCDPLKSRIRGNDGPVAPSAAPKSGCEGDDRDLHFLLVQAA